MKKIIFTSFAIAFCIFANAQSSSPDVIASGGGFAIGTGFTNSFTVGQGSIPETYIQGSFILTQGFQQPSDIGLGMAPVNTASTIGTFPNPSNGQFFLEYTLEENAIVTVDAFDVLGQRIYSETTSRTAGKQMHEVDLSSQVNGIYFVNCIIKTSSGTTTRTSKITVAH
jgi:hypothetical protein